MSAVGKAAADTARRLGRLVEPVAASVSFAPDAHERLGGEYAPGYICSRSACLGPAPWTVVAAAFAA